MWGGGGGVWWVREGRRGRRWCGREVGGLAARGGARTSSDRRPSILAHATPSPPSPSHVQVDRRPFIRRQRLDARKHVALGQPLPRHLFARGRRGGRLAFGGHQGGAAGGAEGGGAGEHWGGRCVAPEQQRRATLDGRDGGRTPPAVRPATAPRQQMRPSANARRRRRRAPHPAAAVGRRRPRHQQLGRRRRRRRRSHPGAHARRAGDAAVGGALSGRRAAARRPRRARARGGRPRADLF